MVKIAPATTTPAACPMDWMITFSSKVLRREKRVPRNTAKMAMGIEVSMTFPVFKPI